MKRSFQLGCLLVLVSTQGCAKWVGNLRKDFDDRVDVPNYEPTFGGQATEAGFLDTPGHADRSPASANQAPAWATNDEYQPTAQRSLASVQGAPGAKEQVPNSDQYADFLPATPRQYQLGHRATKKDFQDNNQNEGSLWASEGQTNYFFIKNKVKSVGDIVTVNVEDDIVKNTILEIKKTLTPEEIQAELRDAQQKLDAAHQAKVRESLAALEKEDLAARTLAANKKVAEAEPDPSKASADGKDAVAKTDAKPEVAPAKETSEMKDLKASVARRALWTDIDVAPQISIKPGETMMGEIIERIPNGNYKVRATKRVPYRDGHRLVSVVGVVKSGDISEDDKINSGKLYEYQLKTFR